MSHRPSQFDPSMNSTTPEFSSPPVSRTGSQDNRVLNNFSSHMLSRHNDFESSAEKVARKGSLEYYRKKFTSQLDSDLVIFKKERRDLKSDSI